MADAFQIGVKEYKAAFFNRHAIEARVDAYRDRELSRLGAFTRTRMKSSLRYRAKASVPGQPPSVHRKGFKRKTVNRKTGVETLRETSPLKELIFFAKTAQGSVVVGPAKFGKKPGIAPPTLERGGPAVITEPIPRPKGRKASPRQSESFQRLVKEGRVVPPPRQTRLKTIRIAPRPFVRPAGEAELRSGKALRVGG
jgi:hypothetical protein